MSKKNQADYTFKVIPLNAITPDETQPRKDFNTHRLRDLMSSIKEYGIRQPLSVQQVGDNTYLLVDGERRYRAAKELGLTEVPAVIEDMTDGVTRTILQFHLQEQHQGWSNVEKAVAMGQLAKEMKVGTKDMARMLALPRETVRQYESFYQLFSQKEFEKSELSIQHARNIERIRNKAVKQFERQTTQLMDDKTKKKVEMETLKRIKNGEIYNSRQVTRIVDVFTADADYITDYLKGKSIEEMYNESQARTTSYGRQIGQVSHNLEEKLNWFLSHGDVHSIESEYINNLKRLNKKITNLLKQAE